MKIKILNESNYDSFLQLTKMSCDFLEIEPTLIEIDELDIDGVNGMCIDYSQNEFLILIRDHKYALRTLAHELVHVKQHMKQNLGSHLDEKSVDYDFAWWEIEARKIADQIMEKYYECYDT